MAWSLLMSRSRRWAMSVCQSRGSGRGSGTGMGRVWCLLQQRGMSVRGSTESGGVGAELGVRRGGGGGGGCRGS